jgi:hypothetical protein
MSEPNPKKVAMPSNATAKGITVLEGVLDPLGDALRLVDQ